MITLKELAWNIYKMPLHRIRLIIFTIVTLWGIFSIPISYKKRIGRVINTILLIAAVLGIVVQTILNRNGGDATIVLLPFNNFIEARQQPELLRSMLMNVLLFVPLGLTLPFSLSDHVNHKIRTSIFIAACFSVVIEIIQYIFGLGRCETDDVIMNTLGTAIGTISYLIYCGWVQFRRRKKKQDG